MHTSTTSEVLNRLWIIHQYSLPHYLAFAPPWWQDGDAPEAQLLGDIVRDQQRLADRLGKLVVDGGGSPIAGRFPGRFTAFHDLSSKFMWTELTRYQVRTIEAIQQCIDQLPRASLPETLAQESLGVAKAHLDSIHELNDERPSGIS